MAGRGGRTMARLALVHHGRPGRRVSLDLRAGRFAVERPGRAVDEAPCGVAGTVRRLGGRREWLALYRHEGVLWFQLGARRWPAADLAGKAEHTLRRSLFLAEFALRGVPGRSVRLRYVVPWVGIMSRVDPTYDGLDHEADDFPSYVASVLNDAAMASTLWPDAAGG